jgi:digeranylgeranylglycerophospholipid reductase
MSKYDVIVVGAGPVGSYTAYQLADKGLKVGLLDAKKEIGQDIICAGVISKQAFKRYDLPSKSILSRIDSATFISPSGRRLEYEPREVFAYVVSRNTFDKGILKAAKHVGVDVKLGYRVENILSKSDYYNVRSAKRQFKTRFVVLATGIDYTLHKKLHLGKPPHFLHGSQVELPISFAASNIQIHIGRDFAPGSFAWVIPAGKNTSRIGLILNRRGKKWLRKMLEQRLNISVRQLNERALRTKPIAYGPVRRSVRDRILTVGEAAGQIKTTTGGGIYFGLLCSEIAVDRIYKALHNGTDLSEYETTWRSALASEFDIGIILRNIAANLSDPDIENLFKFVKKNRYWVNLLVPRIDFDYHSNVIYFCIKGFGALLKHSH